MRVVIQRVSQARVEIGGETTSSIGPGLLVLLGIEPADNREDVEWLVKKITQLRIFDDADGVMNLSVMETGGEVLVVSQFTLHASTKKGNRPSYIRAAGQDAAIPLYELFVETTEAVMGRRAGRGVFGAHMEVFLVNDGPVTIIIDSRNKDL